eukprot:Hpha_TRINITY_DN8365_c0_g2::TRINITY_DN8365_c0_g2_i1::g.154266::m.154266
MAAAAAAADAADALFRFRVAAADASGGAGAGERGRLNALKWKSAQRALRMLDDGWELSRSLDPELLQATRIVVTGWVEAASQGNEGLAGFVAYSRFFEELEEALVALQLLVDARREAPKESPPSPAYDMCCGKGFTGMLLAYAAPLVGTLRESVSEVVMVDWEAKGDMRTGHFDEASKAESCLPLRYARGNIFDPFLLSQLGGGVGCFLGVHLCKRLSPRLCELYLRGGADCMVLSPCCLPHSGTVCLGASTVDAPSLGGYDAWCSWLEGALSLELAEKGRVSSSTAPLSHRHGKQRRSVFILARRNDSTPPPPVSAPPDPASVCMNFYRFGKCRYGGSKCRFLHVRGEWC